MTTTKNDKRPRPYVLEHSQDDLNWDPKPLAQYTFPNEEFDPEGGEAERSGDSFAIVRPGMERWPLGHVSDVYRPSSHRHTVDMLLTGVGDAVEPYGQPLMSGHGYRVVHIFSVKNESSTQIHGLPVTSRLTVVHDHTGLHALKARMCVYVGNNALGSIVGARAIHVAENPERWRVEVQQMIDRSKSAQEALITLLDAASNHILTDADRTLLTALGVKPSGKNSWQATLLDSMVSYHRGAAKTKEITWGVWERRLTDDAILAMVKLLGRKKYGTLLDAALGGKRYGGK